MYWVHTSADLILGPYATAEAAKQAAIGRVIHAATLDEVMAAVEAAQSTAAKFAALRAAWLAPGPVIKSSHFIFKLTVTALAAVIALILIKPEVRRLISARIDAATLGAQRVLSEACAQLPEAEAELSRLSANAWATGVTPALVNQRAEVRRLREQCKKETW